MATCDDRQLTQAELEAGFQQQRTGVVQALRPFVGPRTIDNLCSYVDRELGPAVRNARAKVNDCWQQVTDNAPSANPLGYYFSTNTANADPTAGRVRLDASPENTATTLRVSESNARLQDVSPWLDMMIGGSTTPLGVVTLMDAVNPGRFLRGNLTNITPHTGYRDFAITIFEASTDDPFVDGEAVLVSYVAGMADGGVTVPLAVLSPIASDTFLGNVGVGPAAPAAVNLSTLAGAGLAFGTHTLAVTGSTSITIASDQVQRAALTGDVTASLNSNATTIANDAVTTVKILNANVTNAKLANMSPGRVKGLNIDASGAAAPIDLTGAEVGELIRYAFLDDGAGATGTNNDFAVDVRQGIVRINPGSLGGDVTITGFALNGGGTTNNAGGRFLLVKQGASNKITLKYENAGSSANNRLELPRAQDYELSVENECLLVSYWGGRWQIIGPMRAVTAGTGILISAAGVVTVDQSFSPTWTNAHVFSAPIISNDQVLMNGEFVANGFVDASFGSSQNNWDPVGASLCSVIRATATAASLHITGLAAAQHGSRVILINVGSNPFTLDIGSGSSSAANQFLCNVASFALGQDDVVELWYDGTTQRWRLINVHVPT